MSCERSSEAYASPQAKLGSQRESPVRPGRSNPALCDSLEEWEGVGGGREVQEGGDMCIPVANSCCSMAETNTIL